MVKHKIFAFLIFINASAKAESWSWRVISLLGRPKKRGHRLMTIILSNLNRFTIFFTGRFLSKFAVKWILKIPPHLAYVTTLPCET